jgi:N-methylhydantoinase A/acetone carboxylase, beta subunit
VEDHDKNLLNELFNKEYQKLYGRVLPNADVEVLTWAITLGTFEKKPAPIGNQIKQISAPEMGFRAVFDTSSEKQIKIPVYSRADLKPGAFVDGPALIVEEETSSFIPETFEASIAPNNYIILDRKLEAK